MLEPRPLPVEREACAVSSVSAGAPTLAARSMTYLGSPIDPPPDAPRRHRGLGAALLLAAAVAASCGAGERPARARHVVLIGVDTLRADHLGLYGAERSTSPFLDRMAQEGWVFERAFATSPWTLPSFASLLTGLEPAGHGAGVLPSPGTERGGTEGEDWAERNRLKSRTKLDPAARTLAEALSAAGLRTLAVVQSPNLDPSFDFDRGFDTYDSYDGRGRRADAAVERALELIDEAPEKPFFLFLHLIDPHLNYSAPEPARGCFTRTIEADLELPITSAEIRARKFANYDAVEREFIQAAYDEEIAYVDQQVERFCQGLEQRGLAQDTLVLFTSDHGEEFLDHGGFEHGHSVYNELIRVPLIAWGSGVAAERVPEPVSIVDIAPTVLDALGLEPTLAGPGTSLWKLLAGSRADREARILVAEGTLYGPELRSAILWPYKLIERPEDGVLLLFDLEQDPLELTDLSASRPELTERLAGELQRRIESSARGTRREAVELSDEMVEELRALGYSE